MCSLDRSHHTLGRPQLAHQACKSCSEGALLLPRTLLRLTAQEELGNQGHRHQALDDGVGIAVVAQVVHAHTALQDMSPDGGQSSAGQSLGCCYVSGCFWV